MIGGRKSRQNIGRVKCGRSRWKSRRQRMSSNSSSKTIHSSSSSTIHQRNGINGILSGMAGQVKVFW